MANGEMVMEPDSMPEALLAGIPVGGDRVRRHRLSTRLWHWLNAMTVTIMLMSGLMIFNAHPRLYWGQYGANPDTPWLEIGNAGGHGVLRIGSLALNTGMVLGLTRRPDGSLHATAFPGWMTIPTSYSLSDARMWHLAFALVLVAALLAYLVRSVINGHIRRDLAMRRGEWAPAHLWADIKQHALLRFPTGLAALKYNPLQKIAYGAVLFVMLPLVIATGTALSPGMDARLHWLVDVLGGRQSARSVHFLCAAGLVGFFAVHIAMVLLAGPINEVRSMITGWYVLPKERRAKAPAPGEEIAA